MSTPTWAELADAIQSAIAGASGLTTIWKDQNADAPVVDYVTLELGSLAPVGQDYVTTSTDLGQPKGQEVALTVGGLREVALQIEVFSSATVESVGAASARQTADFIATRLRLPTARTTLAWAGVSILAPGPVNYVPEIVGLGFRGRASLDVRCLMPARPLVERVAYIASFGGTARVSGSSTPFTSP